PRGQPLGELTARAVVGCVTCSVTFREGVDCTLNRTTYGRWDLPAEVCFAQKYRCTRASFRLTFFRSAATCLHSPAARRAASRKTRRGSAGPANGTWSAAAKSSAGLLRGRYRVFDLWKG